MAQKLRFKPGEKAEIISNTSSHYFSIGKIVNITKRDTDGDNKIIFLCCDETGDCWFVNETDLKPINKTKMNTQMKQAVLDTANKLLKAQNTVTTLEIKTQAIQDYPTFFWTQVFVSDTMKDFEQQLMFTITADNGTYRTYSGAGANYQQVVNTVPGFIATPKTKAKLLNLKPSTIGMKKAYELMTTNKGHFFTATFIDRKGEERTMNCQYLKGKQDTLTLGYVKVKESNKLKTGVNPIRQINLQTLKQLRIAGNLYKIRK